MGRFALRDMGATIAAGIVKEITEEFKPSKVDLNDSNCPSQTNKHKSSKT